MYVYGYMYVYLYVNVIPVYMNIDTDNLYFKITKLTLGECSIIYIFH